MESEQGKCPKCGKGGLDYGVSKLDDQSIGYPCSCECGFVGTEWYNLHFTGYYDADGIEIKPTS